MREMEFVVLPTVLLFKESLHVTPRTLDGVSVISGVRIHERNGVIYGAVRVALTPDTPVRSPAVTDECSAGFDPGIYDVRQCAGGSVRYGNKKCSTGLTFHTAKHPLALNRVSPIVFSSTELALDGLVRTTDLLRAALQVNQLCLLAEHTPVHDRVITEVMFVLDMVGRFTSQGVVREVQNHLEGEVTLLKP